MPEGASRPSVVCDRSSEGVADSHPGVTVWGQGFLGLGIWDEGCELGLGKFCSIFQHFPLCYNV